MEDSELSVLGAGSYRSVSILRLTDDERKIVVEALKIARMTALGDPQGTYKLAAIHLKSLVSRFQGANEVWLATSSSVLKSE